MRIELLQKKILEHKGLVDGYREKYRESKSRETLDALSMNCFQAVQLSDRPGGDCGPKAWKGHIPLHLP